MKKHFTFKREKGYKNKRLAQEFGVKTAKSYFSDMQNESYQGFMFTWDSPDDFLSERSKSLFMHFSNSPKNIKELELISYESSMIEFENLRLGFVGELPLRKFSDKEKKENIVKMCTVSFISLKEIDFYHKVKTLTENVDKKWKELFIKFYSLSSLKEESLSKCDLLLEEMKMEFQLREEIVKEVEEYWKCVKI